MKAITILQPWASLIACGAKKIETRGWATKYRGPIAIHAAKDRDKKGERIRHIVARAAQCGVVIPKMEFGSVIAVADLVDVLYIVHNPGTDIDVAKNINIGAESMTLDKHAPDFHKYIVPTEKEISFGDWRPGRYAWLLENVRPITPVPARGQQGLWNWEDSL